MVVCNSGFPARATGFSNGVCIVESDETFVLRTVKRERILNAMRPFRIRLDTFDLELHPIACFIDYICIAVKSQKVFKTAVPWRVFVAHVNRLSESDNSQHDILRSLRKTNSASRYTGVFALLEKSRFLCSVRRGGLRSG